ncbi:hypothetical protein LG272_10495 [Pseudidiomarina marina]|uniref:hypothetical protein n=1 Tax=Pseudidiomarina marina TaxID=502366 RepID=UPI00384E065A
MIQQSITHSKRNYEWSKTLCEHHDFTEFVRDVSLDTSSGLSGSAIDDLLSEWYPSISNRAKRGTKQAFQSALLNIANALSETDRYQEPTGFLCSTLSKYKREIKRYKDNDFSRVLFASVLRDLANRGFLALYRGFKGKNHTKGLLSLWLPTNSARELLSELSASSEVIPFHDSVEPIVLKDDEGELIDYRDNEETRLMRSELELLNELRESVTWAYRPAERIHIDTGKAFLSDQYVALGSRNVRFKRSFKGSFSIGGRYYGNAQCLSKTERSTIIINGEPTTEQDIKSMHVRMLYNYLGKPAPADGYDIDGYDRETAKKVALIALNADSEKSAAGAIRQSLGFTSNEAKQAIESFRQAHKPIAEFLYSSSWKQLQYLDSELARGIQLKAAEQGIPVIPIHDSFLAGASKADTLAEIIHSEYEQRFGFLPVICA